MEMMGLTAAEEELAEVLERHGVGLRAGVDILLRFHVATTTEDSSVVVGHGAGQAGAVEALLAGERVALPSGSVVRLAKDEEEERRGDDGGTVTALPGLCGVCGVVKGKTAFARGSNVCRKCMKVKVVAGTGKKLRGKSLPADGVARALEVKKAGPGKGLKVCGACGVAKGVRGFEKGSLTCRACVDVLGDLEDPAGKALASVIRERGAAEKEKEKGVQGTPGNRYALKPKEVVGERMKLCLYCDQRKPARAFGKGRACLECEGKK